MNKLCDMSYSRPGRSIAGILGNPVAANAYTSIWVHINLRIETHARFSSLSLGRALMVLGRSCKKHNNLMTHSRS